MPTLHAGGYAVPVAPSVEPLREPPDAYQRINAPPGAFGAGMAEGMQAFGQQAAQAAAHQYARQDFLNLTEADKLGAQLDDELHRQKYGDPTAGLDANGRPLVPGFKNRLGSDAIDYIKSGEPAKAFATTIDRVAAGASNSAVKQMFVQQAAKRRQQFDTSLDEHFSSQLLQHNEQTQKAVAAGAARDAAAGADDDAAIKTAGDRFYESYVARSHTSDPATLTGLRAQADADAAEQAIDAALSRDNPARALQIYRNYSTNMPGDRQLKLMDKIQPAVDRQAARRATSSVNEAARAAAASYAEDSAIISQIDQSVKAVADAQRDPDPTVQSDLRHKTRAAIAGSAIEAAIAADKPDRAERLLQTYSDSMDGDRIKKYRNEIQPLIDKQRAAAAAGRTAATTPADHYGHLVSLGASPNEATLLTSAAEAESSFVSTKTHDGGIGYGLYGHNADRLAAMRKQFGERPTWQQQAQFALAELRSRPEGARVNAAKTPEELTELQFEFERPKRGPTDQSAARLESTRRYMTNPPKSAAPAVVAPGPSAAASPPAAGTGAVEVWGDSLGVGLKGQLKTEGSVVGGARPSAILASIKAKPANHWQGKTIVLPSGSNGNEMDKVEETIGYLQGNGANVVAVGYGPKFPEKNAQLRQIAQRLNVPVVEAEHVDPVEGVHPSGAGYARMAGRVRALSAPSRITVPPANAAPPPGMVAPGTITPPPG